MTNAVPATISSDAEIVVRSNVPVGLKYGQYRKYLRNDFFYSCAYCTMSEVEGYATRFTVDHYEPQIARPDLADDYNNLMYACDGCNVKKGPRSPTDKHRAAGFRFFRVDADRHSEHYRLDQVRLNSLTPVGEYTIQALDLNRPTLRRLRELRRRFTDCHEQIAGGILALRSLHVDRLPTQIKRQAIRLVSNYTTSAAELRSSIDEMLRQNAISPLSVDDPDLVERTAERKAYMQRLNITYPED